MSLSGWLRRLFHGGRRALLFVLVLLMLAGSTLVFTEQFDRIQAYARMYEFDFLGWTVDALGVKIGQWGLDAASYLREPVQEDILLGYMQLVEDVNRETRQLEDLLGDPGVGENSEQIDRQVTQLEQLRQEEAALQPVAESILQEQIASEISELGIQLAGVPAPPVAFQFSPLPSALIVSPRDTIRQDANISLELDIPLEQKIELENVVESDLDVSALVVAIGGLGTYPTMVQESPSLNWVAEVVAHEWIHNHLSFRPLGIRYNESPELRTMNETTANLMGKEIGHRVLERHYEFLIPEEPVVTGESPVEPPAFDFRAEMRETRVTVDELLEEGLIEEAEAYMEERRIFFWENGYRIRKLNQAYFAFHGAYADEPGGAAGDDPVGEAVRLLWDLVDSPREFLQIMGGMTSFQELQTVLKGYSTNP